MPPRLSHSDALATLFPILFLESFVLGPSQRSRHSRVRLDILALREALPQVAQERALLAVVEVAQERLESLGSLMGLVEGDSPVSWVSSRSHTRSSELFRGRQETQEHTASAKRSFCETED